MREITFAGWADAVPVSSVASVTLDMSKDNVQLGACGQPRPGAFCQVITSYLHRGLAADIVRS